MRGSVRVAELIPFNANEIVKVKLREKGVEIMKERDKELNDRLKSVGIVQGLGELKLNLDDQGYVDFQLWSLFEIFGKHIKYGHEPPFELDVIFVKD